MISHRKLERPANPEQWWPSLMFHKSAVALIMVLVAAAAFARSKAEAHEKQENVYAELGKAPRKAARRSNPLQNDPEAVAAGAKLFGEHCAECHGEMAEGGRKAPSLLADPVQQVTPGTLFWLLSNGVVRRGMPDWSKLPEPQRWQLVSYIKSLAPAPMEVPDKKSLAEDPPKIER